MRKLGIVLGILFLLIVIAGIVFYATFDINHYRGRIQTELQQRLGRDVSLGDMHLKIFPPSFEVQNVSIADDPSFGSQAPFVQAAELDVSVQLAPLFHKQVEVNSLELKRPKVELVKDQKGAWNFSTLGNKNAQSAPSTPSQQGSSSQGFSLAHLIVTDGQIAVTDRQAGQPRSVYDHIDVNLNDFSADHPFNLQLAAHLPGPGSQEIQLQGQGGPVAQSNPAATPFHGTLNLKNVAISGVKQFLNSPALNNMEATLTGQTKVDTDAGKLSASGQTTIQNARVNGTDIGYPIVADYTVSDDLANSLLTINRGTVKLGQTPLAVTGTVNTKQTPPNLDLHLQASNVSIAEAARLASAFGVAFAPGTTVNGQMTADVQARGSASKPILNGTLSAANVQVSGSNVPQPVEVKAVKFNLTPNEVRSDPFNVTSGDTTVAAQVGVKQYTSAAPIMDATLQAPNAKLPAVLAMARAYGVTALDKISGLGDLNLNMHLTGPVKSISSAEVVRALNGTLNLGLNNIRMNGADVNHQLASIAGFLKPGQSDQGFTNISRLTGDIVVTNGVAQTNNLQALLDLGNVAVKGNANLVTQALNLTANAVLSKSTSQSVGGTGVGGFMNTALSNNQGELVIPILITGTFQNPHFAPDLQSVAQMKLKGLVPSFDNPGGALSGVVGGLLGQKQGAQQGQPGQAEQQQQPAQNAVQQVLGGLFGGKKQPKKPNPPQ
jgi:AsmA protein